LGNTINKSLNIFRGFGPPSPDLLHLFFKRFAVAEVIVCREGVGVSLTPPLARQTQAPNSCKHETMYVNYWDAHTPYGFVHMCAASVKVHANMKPAIKYGMGWWDHASGGWVRRESTGM